MMGKGRQSGEQTVEARQEIVTWSRMNQNIPPPLFDSARGGPLA
jgi:hypothetical protein